MKRMLGIAVCAGLAAMVLPGCLVQDTTEAWYVDAAGGVSWVATESEVRSNANNLDDRQQEESVYWLAVQQQRHPIATGLQELGGTKLRTTVLRSEAPYTVRTEARFAGLDEIGRRMLASVGALGESTVTHEGPNWEWKVVARDPNSMGSTSEPSEGVSQLMAELPKLKIVLLAGRFESAQGFTLSNDRRVAMFDDRYADGQAEVQAFTMKLAWK
jgi:hypothetical protein